MSEFPKFGTTPLEAPATRADLERALRNANATTVESRDALLQLAAHVIALTDELAARLGDDLASNVAAQIPARLAEIQLADARAVQRVDLDPDDDKYEVTPTDVPCMELMHICKARCCRLRFSLSSKDLDEGIIRWDYGKPYQIRQRASDGYCVHNDPASGGCTVHPSRPKICRTYSCATDKRIWLDFENKIVAPMEAVYTAAPDRPELTELDLVGRLRERRLAHELERSSVEEGYAEPAPRRGT